MSRRSGIGKLFVGRLSKRANNRDLEEVFEHYGRLAGCDIKYGAEMAYAFVDFEDRRDAEDAVRKANGTEVCGSSIVVEWAKGGPRASSDSQPRYNKKTNNQTAHDECYKCHRTGHWARDCPEDDYRGYRRRSASPSRGGGGGSSSRRDRDSRDSGRRRSRSRSYERRDSRSDRRRSRSASKEDNKKSASRSRSRSPRSRGSSKS